MSIDKRAFKGVWIPAELWLDENISKIEMLFLTEIDSLDNENGCFAGNEYFSEFFRLSISRCSEIINSLKSKGYLNIKYEHEGKQIIKRVIKCVRKYKNSAPLRKTEYQKDLTPSENRSTSSEKAIDNNTFNNTIHTSNPDGFDDSQKLVKPKKQKTSEQQAIDNATYKAYDDILKICSNHKQPLNPDKHLKNGIFSTIKREGIERTILAVNNYFIESMEPPDKNKPILGQINTLFYQASRIARFANKCQVKSNKPYDIPEEVWESIQRKIKNGEI